MQLNASILCIWHSSPLNSRPSQSKGLLYKHRCHSLIHSLIHWSFSSPSLRHRQPQTSVGLIFRFFEYIWIYLDKYIHLSKYSLFFPRQIYLDIHSWPIYSDKDIGIFICSISMIANIFKFLCFQKCLKMVLLVKNGVILVNKKKKKYKNTKMAKIVQNSHGQMIWYSSIFKYFWQIYSFEKIFVVFLEQIYSDIHLWSFYYAKYFWIFICPISGKLYIQIFIRSKKVYSSHTAQNGFLFQLYNRL